MITAQKNLWAAANMPAIAIYDSEDNLRLNFSLNFISLMTWSSPGRHLFLHGLSFELTTNLCINFLKQFYFIFTFE